LIDLLPSLEDCERVANLEIASDRENPGILFCPELLHSIEIYV